MNHGSMAMALKQKPSLPREFAWVSTSENARPSRINFKDMLTVFFYHECVIYHVYTPAGQTATKEYHIEILRRLTVAVGIKRLHVIDYLL